VYVANSQPTIGGRIRGHRLHVNPWPYKVLRWGPVTVATALGPAVDVANTLLHGHEAATTGVSFAQLFRGSLALGMILSLRVATTREAFRFGLVRALVLLALDGLAVGLLTGEYLEGVQHSFRIAFLVLAVVAAYDLGLSEANADKWVSALAWTNLLGVIASQIGGVVVGSTAFAETSAYRTSEAYRSPYALPGLTFLPSLPAASLVAGLPLFLRKREQRPMDAVGVLLTAIATAATLRRSAIIAVVSVLVAYAILRMARTTNVVKVMRTITLLAGAAMVLTAVALFSPLKDPLADRMAEMNLQEGGTASGRAVFVPLAASHVASGSNLEIILGRGFRALPDTLRAEFGITIGAHNDWLDFAAAQGLLAVALFLVVCLSPLSRVFGRERLSNGRLAAVLVILIMSVTTGGVLDVTFAPLFALLGVSAAAERQFLSVRFGCRRTWSEL